MTEVHAQLIAIVAIPVLSFLGGRVNSTFSEAEIGLGGAGGGGGGGGGPTPTPVPLASEHGFNSWNPVFEDDGTEATIAGTPSITGIGPDLGLVLIDDLGGQVLVEAPYDGAATFFCSQITSGNWSLFLYASTGAFPFPYMSAIVDLPACGGGPIEAEYVANITSIDTEVIGSDMAITVEATLTSTSLVPDTAGWAISSIPAFDPLLPFGRDSDGGSESITLSCAAIAQSHTENGSAWAYFATWAHPTNLVARSSVEIPEC